MLLLHSNTFKDIPDRMQQETVRQCISWFMHKDATLEIM